MRRRIVTAAVAVLALSALPALSAPTAAVAGAAPPAASTTAAADGRMPGDVPSKRTPWVLDGEVSKIVQVGEVMVAGGHFTQVADPMNGTPHTRQNLVVFDAATGAVSPTFNPTVDGAVQQLLPGPTANTVYVAGDFTKINGKGPNHLQLLDVRTGLAVSSFRAPTTNGGIQTMDLLPGNRLFIGGFFTKVGGVTHGQLVTLNASTGALDPFLDLTVSGHHNNTGSGAQGPVGPREAGVTPAGDRLVVVGNFRTVAGHARNQIVMLDLTGDVASVSTDWSTAQYAPVCGPQAYDSYMRDVEMSPDGSFFVVATTGGPNSGTLCDTAARFETHAVGTALTPTWTASTGGDTLWGVEVTRSAVYVGGHQRWLNNPSGADRAAQGAVPRPGLAALDPRSGVPLRWNPGRNPRGEAAYEVVETEAGVWVVSDTDWVGNRRYQRPRIAFFPYSEGYDTASTSTGTLPGNVYVGAPRAATNVLHRVNAGGPALASVDGGPDWASDTGATSPLRTSGSTTASRGALTAANLVGVPASAPPGIWTSERYDPPGGNEMRWTLPVASGTRAQVRIFFASRSTSVRRFSVAIDGVTRLSGHDPNVDPGVGKGTMKAFDVVSDGVVDIDFTHVAGDPLVNAVEVVDTGARSSSDVASVISFDGSAVASRHDVTTASGLDWTTVRGAFMVGRTLFYGAADGLLHRRSFDGVAFGPATPVNPYLDPLWSGVPTGSGPAGQTYAGVLPAWYGQLAGVTGMAYADGRVYYSRSGQPGLSWRWFSPDSGIVGGVEHTVVGTGGISWGTAQGMFLDGTALYVVDPTGQLLRTSLAAGTLTGTATVADATTDWRGRAVFLASVLPNAAPTAAFTADCAGLACAFDAGGAGGSTDPDGSISSYEWTFGDGEEGGGPAPRKDFAETGTYDVTLTVTDDGGLTSSVTRQVSVVRPNTPPTASFTATCDFLECAFDAGATTDGDGTVADLAWDFGDGTTGTGSAPDHAYARPGTYTVELVATDDDGATSRASSTQHVVAAPAPSTVAYVAGAANQGNVATPNVTVPASVSAGDRLVLALSLNTTGRALSSPSGVTGWTVLGTATSGSMQTRLYTKVAAAADAGRRVTVTLDAAAKYTMTVAGYAGARPGALVQASLAETVLRPDHATPAVEVPSGSWVVSYWADKSSATTGFALPGVVTGRQALCSTGTGHVCSALADSGGPVPSGRYGDLVATADAASATATTWSVVLRTVEPNQPPTAAVTYACDGTRCDFDATASTDPDGGVASYAWDLGEGATAAGATTTHDFLTSGTREVRLTVTDDEGAEGSVVVPVTVTRHNAAPTASLTADCTFLACRFEAAASTDPDGSLVSYAWDFGDGSATTAESSTATHAYAAGGPVVVQLTVTDDSGGTATTSHDLTPVAARPLTHVASSVNQGNVSTPNAVIPSGTTAGDRLVMVLSLNDATRTVGSPTGVGGWTLADSATSGTLHTLVYLKEAAAGDAGRTVRLSMDAAAKYTLTVAAYGGDMLAPRLAKATETVVRAGHPAPAVEAAAGDWVVSYWADKSSATTSLAHPEGTVRRQAACGANAGRVCSLLADSGGPVPAGPHGPLTATADAASGAATMWSLLLPQAGRP
ncbi:PKD domain-containing protein [Nocardioides dongkuii]|uniref:PKD domain-containing protein n=1 Tax=Nocardioides dongkuii TaxID=2760089 RepID=UPI0015F92BA4|nr:PKD domain-containing protein [Nocardioides dongkuii]